MEILQAIVLGIVQGATEFLPVSSSAHLFLVPWILGWKDQGLAVDVAFHWGTLIAVLAYFRNDIKRVLKIARYLLEKNPGSEHKEYIKNHKNHLRIFSLIIIASIPGGLLGVLFDKYIENIFRSPVYMAINLLVFGVILYRADKRSSKEKNIRTASFKEILVIGFSQALAIFPGVSRSGATISAGLLLGFKRAEAAKFSFLLAVPIILGAGLKEIPQIYRNGGLGIDLFAGLIASAVSGFLVIKYMLAYLGKGDYRIFVWYRIILALIILGMILFK